MKQILYGVGKSVLRDYTNRKSIVALSKLKDVSINFTNDEEPITGGDDPYPIAYFSKDKAISVTATNALFDMKMLKATQGADIQIGQVVMTEIIEAEIPSNGIITLDYKPLADTTTIDGYTEVLDELSLAAGKFFVDTTNDQIKFDTSDAGKVIEGIYDRNSGNNASTTSILKDTLAKPFEFIHRIPVYDENTQVVGQAQLTIYKAKANGNFEFNMTPQTAYAPKIELKALDPKRSDKKLWDFIIDPVTSS